MPGRIRPEWVAGFNRNRWPKCSGICTQTLLSTGFPGTAEVELHAIQVRPVIERRRGELGAVVALDDRREPTDAIASVAEHPCDIVPAERAGHGKGDALPRVDIHQGEDAHMLPVARTS